MSGLLDLERSPYISEHAYFAANPRTAGMMTEDGRVVLQPMLMGQSRDAVKLNETARLAMLGYTPSSTLTDSQKSFFSGTPYESDSQNAIKSVFARIFSGDPSVTPSFEQDSEYRKIRQIGGLLGGWK